MMHHVPQRIIHLQRLSPIITRTSLLATIHRCQTLNYQTRFVPRSTPCAAVPTLNRWIQINAIRAATEPTPTTPSATPNPTPSPSSKPTTSSSTAGSSSSPPPPLNRSPNTSGSGGRKRNNTEDNNMLQYLVGLTILVIGASWGAIPLYRAFCAHTGYGGTTQEDKDGSKLATMTPSKKEIIITFNADVSPMMHWKFVPSQRELKIKFGEPVLAFYKATNLRDKAVTGVATYNVTPNKAGLYFHKIQCFCFDEQRLRANETVDMPVFFYLDPEMETDYRTKDITHLTLSYTFFPVPDDEDDTRTEEEKDAAMMGVRSHGTEGIPQLSDRATKALANAGVTIPTAHALATAPPTTKSSAAAPTNAK